MSPAGLTQPSGPWEDHRVRRLLSLLALLLALAWPGPGRAGLYYSGENLADLPAQWGGFLLDQRLLRQTAVKPTDTTPAGPFRNRYEKEAARLAALGERRSADESADLGALY